MADNEDVEKFQEMYTENINTLIEEMDKFKKITAPEIIKLINKEDYLVATGVMGLVAVIRMIIDKVGNEVLLQYAIEALQEDTEELHEENTTN